MYRHVFRFGPGSQSTMHNDNRCDVWSFVLALFLLLPSAALAKKTPPAHPLDINTATVKQLEQLPGVGPTTAKAIVEFRTKAGRFQRVTDLLVIRGISESKLKKMRPYITVGPPPKPAAAAHSAVHVGPAPPH